MPPQCVMCEKTIVHEKGATGPIYYTHCNEDIYCPACFRRLTVAAPALLDGAEHAMHHLTEAFPHFSTPTARELDLEARLMDQRLMVRVHLRAAIAEAKPEAES